MTPIEIGVVVYAVLLAVLLNMYSARIERKEAERRRAVMEWIEKIRKGEEE